MQRFIGERRRGLSTAARSLILGVLALAGCGAAQVDALSSHAAPSGGILRWTDEGVQELPSMDPNLGGDANSVVVIALIFDNLVQLDLHNRPVPDGASWTVSADGRTYTFRLRPTWRFSDGHRVTADDVVFSMQRILDPAGSGGAAYSFLSHIVGSGPYNAGKSKTLPGVQAVNPSTVVFHLDRPTPYFPDELTGGWAAIYEKAAILKDGTIDNTKWDEHPVGAGPFMLKQWIHNQEIRLVPNPYYYQGVPSVKEIDVLFVADPETAVSLYDTNGADIVGTVQFPSTQLGTVRGMPGFNAGVRLETTYLTPNEKLAPFNNRHVRRAFSLTINRKAIADVILNGAVSAAAGILPPGMPGYNPYLHTLDYSPAQAQKELALAGYPNGKNFPKTVYTYPSNGPDEDRRAAALQQLWRQVLHVNVLLNKMEPGAYNNLLTARTYQLGIIPSSADYPDPQDFLSLALRSGSPGNNGNYSNPAFDRLVDRADTLVGQQAARLRLYQQAEQIAVNDAAWIPLSNARSAVLIRPGIRGILVQGIGLYGEGIAVPDWTKVRVP